VHKFCNIKLIYYYYYYNDIEYKFDKNQNFLKCKNQLVYRNRNDDHEETKIRWYKLLCSENLGGFTYNINFFV